MLHFTHISMPDTWLTQASSFFFNPFLLCSNKTLYIVHLSHILKTKYLLYKYSIYMSLFHTVNQHLSLVILKNIFQYSKSIYPIRDKNPSSVVAHYISV